MGWKIAPFDNCLKVLECFGEEGRILLSYSYRRVLRFEMKLCFRHEEMDVVLPVLFYSISKDFDQCVSYTVLHIMEIIASFVKWHMVRKTNNISRDLYFQQHSVHSKVHDLCKNILMFYFDLRNSCGLSLCEAVTITEYRYRFRNVNSHHERKTQY
jgi:hypothetical protein